MSADSTRAFYCRKAERGDAVIAVVDWAGRTGEVKDVVNSACVERLAGIFSANLKRGSFFSCTRLATASQQVVNGDSAPAFGQQGIAQAGPQKSSTTGERNAVGMRSAPLSKRGAITLLQDSTGPPTGTLSVR